jgi:hypothetical protein
VQNLAPGQGGVITLTGVLSDPLAAGTFTNTATITLTNTDGNPGNNSSGIGVLVIDNQPPIFSNPASALITPTQGITVTTPRPLFDWTDATDNDGVVGYTLVMTTSGDNLSLQAVGSITVAQSNYIPANNLPNGVYTWTVSAYDAAGNVSNPVSPATFVLSVGDQVLCVWPKSAVPITEKAQTAGCRDYAPGATQEASFTFYSLYEHFSRPRLAHLYRDAR